MLFLLKETVTIKTTAFRVFFLFPLCKEFETNPRGQFEQFYSKHFAGNAFRKVVILWQQTAF